MFGASTGPGASLELSALTGANGFALNGISAGDSSGRSVSGAGDVNGDGIDDLIVGANGADPNGPFSGQSYVVFGASLELSALDGNNGFALNGITAGDFSGRSVSGAGDRAATPFRSFSSRLVDNPCSAALYPQFNHGFRGERRGRPPPRPSPERRLREPHT